nr:integrase, catalytic region, zinc finger, CCHC-type, peptidase aspartic, catalytic [Tanacetum cinerariifolium]
MEDEHLDTILATESDEFIKSSVENLVPNPSESEGEHECDVPACDDFNTSSNILFDADYDFSSSDDESFSDEDISKKIYSNPLFDEEIISIKIDPHHFNADEEIRLVKRLLYDNSSPRPPEEYDSENSIAAIESFSPSPIPVEDNDPLIEEIDLFLASDRSIPPGIDNDYSDSERDHLFLERLLHDDLIPLSNTHDFSNVVRFFLPFFTYPVTSSILLSSGSEDTIFDPDIFNYHFSSLEPGVSHRRFLKIVKTRACFQSFNHQVVQIVLWYLDSGCSRHMTRDLSKLINYVDKFIGTVRFENDEFATIVGYDGNPDHKPLGKYVAKKIAIPNSRCSTRTVINVPHGIECLSPKSTGFNEFSSNIATAMGEGSGTPTEHHHTPSPEAQLSSPTAPSSPTLPPATTETIPTVIPTDIPSLRQYSRRARIAQSLALPTAADEHASPFGDDNQGEACTTISGLEAEQDRANIIKTSTLPHDSTPRVTSLAADEGNMQHKLNELTDLCTRLIKMLEDKDGGGDEPSGEDTTIKGRILETGEEAAIEKSIERGSNDIEELVNVLTSLDAASILTIEVQMVSVPPTAEVATVSVLTGSGMVPTASLILPLLVWLHPTQGEKVAGEMEEQIAREDQKMNEQISKDTKIARIHAEEELQMLIDRLDRNNETVAKYLQEYEQFAADLSIGERIELINNLLVPVEEVYVEALQVKHLIINWEIHTEGQRNYWKIIMLGGNTAVYQFFIDTLKHFDREDLNQLWSIKFRGGFLGIKCLGIPTTSDEFPLPEDFPTASEERFPLLRELGHTGEIMFLSDVNVNHMHQPWRSLAAIINKCLSGKTTALESLRLSRAQILWGVYYNKKVDYVYLLWEDLVFQVENKNSKKNNDMYYPRFTKVIVDYFMAKDQAIPRRTKMFWHYAQDTQVYGAILSQHLTNQAMFESKAHRTYRAYATREKTPKPNLQRRKLILNHLLRRSLLKVSKGKRIKTSAKGDKPVKMKQSASDGVDILSKVPDEQQQTVSGTNEGDCDKPEDDNDEHNNANDNDNEDGDQENVSREAKLDDEGDDFVYPNLSTYNAYAQDKEEKVNDDDKVSSDQKVSTLFDYGIPDEEDNQEDDDKVMGGEQEDEELMKDEVNVAVQLQSNKLREEAQAENDEFLKQIDSNIKAIIKDQVKAQVSKIFPKVVKEDVMIKTKMKNPLLDQTDGRSKGDQARKSHQKKQLKRSPSLQVLSKTIDDQPPQSWMTQLAQALGTQSLFNEFLATPVDFSTFIMNRFKIYNLTQDVLTGRQVIPFDHFINNDLEYLKGGSLSQKYTTLITKTKATDYDHVQWIEYKVLRSIWSPTQVVNDKHAYWGTYHRGPKRQKFYGYATNMKTSNDVYSRHRIIAVTSLKIIEFFCYKHLEEIIVRRQDDRLYKFREGDFKRLRRQYIEDMLLLPIQGKLTNLNLDESDGTLNYVRTALNDIATGIQMEYLPKRK